MTGEEFLRVLSDFGPSTGEHWSKENSQFEQTAPGLMARFGRALNPMTAFGSALGAMHDGAGKGSPAEMGAALLQALPMFGATKVLATPGIGLLKSGTRIAPDLYRTLVQAGLGTSAGVAVDTAQAAPEKKANK